MNLDHRVRNDFIGVHNGKGGVRNGNFGYGRAEVRNGQFTK